MDSIGHHGLESRLIKLDSKIPDSHFQTKETFYISDFDYLTSPGRVFAKIYSVQIFGICVEHKFFIYEKKLKTLKVHFLKMRTKIC